MANSDYLTYADTYYSYHEPATGDVHKTLAGHDVLIYLDGQEIGRAQSISGTIDFGVEPVMEIGSMKPQEFVPLRYSGSITLERYLVRNDDLVKVLDRANIPFDLSQEGYILLHSITGFEIMVKDKYTNDVIRSYRNCVFSSTDETVTAAGIGGERATILFSEVVGGLPKNATT